MNLDQHPALSLTQRFTFWMTWLLRLLQTVIHAILNWTLSWFAIFPRVLEVITLVDAIRIFAYPLLRNPRLFATTPALVGMRDAAMSLPFGPEPQHAWAYLFIAAVSLDVLGLVLMQWAPIVAYPTRMAAMFVIMSAFLFVSFAIMQANPGGTGVSNYQNRAAVAVIVFVGLWAKLGKYLALRRYDAELAKHYVDH